jgi:hypothetical protein
MANPIGQVISLWPGGGKTALCLQANFHSGAGPQDRRTSCATVHHCPCTGSVSNEKIAVESYTIKTGAVMRYSQTKRRTRSVVC